MQPDLALLNYTKYRKELLKLGLSQNLSFEKRIGVVLTNQINIIAILSSLAYCVFVIALGQYSLLIIAFFTILGYLTSLWLNSKNHLFFAKLLMLCTCSTGIYIFASILGRDSGLQWVLIPIVVGSFIAYYDEKPKWRSWVPLLLPVTYFVLLEISEYRQFITWFEIPFTDFQIRALYLLNVATVIGLLISIFLYHYTITRKQAQNIIANEASLLQTSRLARVGFSEVNIKKGTAEWHPGLKDLMGVPEDFVVNWETFMPLVHPDSKESFSVEIQDAFEHKDEFDFEYKVIRPKDGKTIHIHSLGKIIRDKAGNPEIMRAVLQDVTSDREKEAKIQQERNRAEAANHAKSRFLSNISHEIRTPLNGLLGFAQLLRDSELSSAQKKQLSLLTYSGETLLSLIDDLLDVTRIEQGKIEIKADHFELSGLLEQCLAPYQLQAKEKGLAFHVQKEFVHDLTLFADALRIKQILANLVSNAIKYTPTGEVRVKVSCQSRNEKNLQLMLEVSDTGPGIMKDAQQTIFKPFTQLGIKYENSQNGLGLGLSIVYGLLHLMKGEIKLISPYQASPCAPGCKFIANIPAEVGWIETTTAAKTTHNQQFKEAIKVLVAEDNEINQILIETILSKEGFDVIIVDQGDIAVEYALTNVVDLILMDVQMPIMDGYEAAQEIRRKLPNLPIIALSANAYPEDKAKSLQAGMNAHLSKPFQIKDLYACISELIPDLLTASSSSALSQDIL